MKTQEQIQEKVQNFLKLMDREENKDEAMQLKLWAYVDILLWVLREE